MVALTMTEKRWMNQLDKRIDRCMPLTSAEMKRYRRLMTKKNKKTTTMRSKGDPTVTSINKLLGGWRF